MLRWLLPLMEETVAESESAVAGSTKTTANKADIRN
jgi:hypothetical protein